MDPRERGGNAAVLERPVEAVVAAGGRGRPPREGPPQQEEEDHHEPPHIAERKDELKNLVKAHDTVILKGHTGSGKSLFGPSYVLEALQELNPEKRVRMYIAEPSKMVVEENTKKVAAINQKTMGEIARMGGPYVGFSHGDKTEFIKDGEDATQLVFTVNGSLQKRIEEDDQLKDFDAIFLDEIHVRDQYQEAIITGIEKVQKAREKAKLKPLKVIIASASISDETKNEFSNFFGDAGFIEVAGETSKHVDEVYLPEDGPSLTPQEIPLAMAKKAFDVIKDRRNYGDVLGFLPGKVEIRQCKDEFDRLMAEAGLSETYKSGRLIGGDDEESRQTRDVLANNSTTREPVFAIGTNAAETGVTFERLTKVIDSGLARAKLYNDNLGISPLETIPHTKHQKQQRAGRVGRTAEGEFYAMYKQSELDARLDSTAPAIEREELTAFVLSLKMMGITDVHNAPYLKKPAPERLDKAVATLTHLGALNPDGSLTQIGREMGDLPVEPHVARMLVEAKEQKCAEAVSIIAGMLEADGTLFVQQKDDRRTFREKYGQFIPPSPPAAPTNSDYLIALRVWNEFIKQSREGGGDWAQANSVNIGVLIGGLLTKRDLAKDFGFSRDNKEIDVEGQAVAIQKCVVAGLQDQLITRDSGSYRFKNGGNAQIQIDRSSVLTGQAEKFVAGDVRRVQEGSPIVRASMNQLVTGALLSTEGQVPVGVVGASAPAVSAAAQVDVSMIQTPAQVREATAAGVGTRTAVEPATTRVVVSETPAAAVVVSPVEELGVVGADMIQTPAQVRAATTAAVSARAAAAPPVTPEARATAALEKAAVVHKEEKKHDNRAHAGPGLGTRLKFAARKLLYGILPGKNEH